MNILHNIKLSTFCFGLFLLTGLNVTGYAALSSYQEDLNVAAYAAALHDVDFALSKYQQITKKYPHEAGGWFALGEFLFQQKKLSEAEAAFNQALAVDSKYSGVHLRLGEIAYRNKDYANALMHFENEKSQAGDAHYWMGRVYEAQQNGSAAEKAYKKAGKKKTGYGDAADISKYLLDIQAGESPSALTTETKARPWDLRLGSGFLYTDNVAGSDGKTLRPADMDRRWDFGWNYDVAAAYKALDTEHFDFTVRYDLDHLIYFEAEDLNQLSNRIQLDPETHFLTSLFYAFEHLRSSC